MTRSRAIEQTLWHYPIVMAFARSVPRNLGPAFFDERMRDFFSQHFHIFRGIQIEAAHMLKAQPILHRAKNRG